MNKHFLFIVVLFLLSCHDKKATSLTGDGYKYWDVVDIYREKYPTHFDIPAYSYKFTSDGDCFYYFHEPQGHDTIRKLFDFDDVIVTNKWKFKNDSTINILGWDYLYRFIGRDTIVLIFSKKKSDSTVIVTSKKHFYER